MLQDRTYSTFKGLISLSSIGIVCLLTSPIYAQDSSKSVLDVNNFKLIKKANQFLDSNQKKINSFFNKKLENAKDGLNKKTTELLDKAGISEIDKPLPYERLLNKKYTLGRRAYQNTVSQFNYLFNAEISLNEIIEKARAIHEDDFTEILPFYDYDLSVTSKESIDSIIYRCNANIVLHDLRSNYVDDAYLLLAKAYLYHKDFDTAGSILQFINYSFYDKEDGADRPIGSNINQGGKFSIASKETGRIWENKNVRNESMLWQARNYFEAGEINEGISLLQLLKTDLGFPKRLQPFLYEQLAYGYYQSGQYENAANYLISGLDNAKDIQTRARWTYLIAQLYEREQKLNLAYKWYKKASLINTNPIIAVYAQIYMASIASNRSEKSWESFATTLERMLRKDKYRNFADIIYYEMAQLAIKNKANNKANTWLLTSIKRNEQNAKLKQKAFIQLGELNYNTGNYAIAKIAYEKLTGLLKSHPNYGQINLRTKWIDKISENDQAISKEDTLQYIYSIAAERQQAYFEKWQKRTAELEEKYKNLLTDSIKNNTKEIAIEQSSKNGVRKNNFSFSNAFETNPTNKQNPKAEFYFDNPQNINNGIDNYIKKWGNRPNVDNWRRKTSIQISKSIPTISTAGEDQNLVAEKITKENINKEVKISVELIKSNSEKESSMELWSTKNLELARIFLYELDDFEKAFPRYNMIIEKNINAISTESALLDLASHYIHVGVAYKSDSLIALISSRFPNGNYLKKKKNKESYEFANRENNDLYKENYFLAQIGDWANFSAGMVENEKQLTNTKWLTPYQFLKVKMFAQAHSDSLAIDLLNEIISKNKSEPIKARAKNIITEINNRKVTEAYLDTLKIVAINKSLNTAPLEVTNPLEAVVSTKNENKQITNLKKDSAVSIIEINQIVFTNDSLEQHYIALNTMNVTPVFVKEIQNALKDINADAFRPLNLTVTFIQFEAQSHIVWIGPFDNATAGIQYINKIKPRLSTEIISFIPKNQYDLTLIGKSNIILISNQVQLDQYKRTKINYYFKP